MTDDLTELDGVAETRQEKLNDSGYETYADLAEGDPAKISDSINRLTEDAALDLVVQSQNMVELEEAEVSSSEDETNEVVEAAEEVIEETVDKEEESVEENVENSESGAETYTVELLFEDSLEYDTFYHTLIEERCDLKRTHRSGLETYEKMLSSMRGATVNEEFSVEMTEDELNDLHNAILEQRISYQGENLIDYMDALRRVENKVNAIREAQLF